MQDPGSSIPGNDHGSFKVEWPFSHQVYFLLILKEALCKGRLVCYKYVYSVQVWFEVEKSSIWVANNNDSCLQIKVRKNLHVHP